MDQEKALAIAEKYAASVRQVLDAMDVFLFGSNARGTANSNSDIDIAADAQHRRQYRAGVTGGR